MVSVDQARAMERRLAQRTGSSAVFNLLSSCRSIGDHSILGNSRVGCNHWVKSSGTHSYYCYRLPLISWWSKVADYHLDICANFRLFPAPFRWLQRQEVRQFRDQLRSVSTSRSQPPTLLCGKLPSLRMSALDLVSTIAPSFQPMRYVY